MANELTQDRVNELFKDIKAEWDDMVLKSGQSEQMFIALGSEDATHFLAKNQLAKENVESTGLVYPDLVKGLTVKIS